MNETSFNQLVKEAESTGRVKKELLEYKVDNAVILAAGITKETIYAPPKGLFLVDGLPLIERLILQLRETGIKDIYIVVGYKKEMYFYLEDKHGVKLIGNPHLEKNNVWSLYLARKYLKNTYICACDYYYANNPFALYEYKAYHFTTFLNDANNHFVVSVNTKGRIIGVKAGAKCGECTYGIAYFDRAFSDSMVRFLEEEINNYRIHSLFWQEFYAKHIDDLDLYVKHVAADTAMEFNELRELKSMNQLFVDSVSSEIVKNICEQLSCSKEDISSVDILDTGHSNITFKVVVSGKKYVYRYPGVSGKNIVSREREIFANKIGKTLGIDNTLLWIGRSGHKLSIFTENSHPLDPKNPAEMSALARCVRKLHDFDISYDNRRRYAFDPIKEADRLLNMACANKDNLFIVFGNLRREVFSINEEVEKDNFKKALCHGNISCNNCLITDNSFELIDWEFAGFSDIAFDYPHDYEFEKEDLYSYLINYYGRQPTNKEYRHWLSYRVIHYWYYTCWAIYKESLNEDCGNRLLEFYEACKRLIKLSQTV